MKVRNFILSSIFFLVIVIPSVSHSTPEFAKETGKKCSVCHLHPEGGGPLTEEGVRFLNNMERRGYRPGVNWFHLLVGYIHLVVGVLWFGTILYVHIVLKPAYAAKGVPKSELMLGWTSIVIMGVTGVTLSFYRITSLDELFTTRFGVLLLIKIVFYVVMVFTAVFVTFVFKPVIQKVIEERECRVRDGKLTPDDVAACDGDRGAPAYIIYKGVVYDVSQSKLWKGGVHFGRHRAGGDLTAALSQAPHGEDKILKMPVVGTVTETKTSISSWQKVFFFFAYLNLFLVLGILFIVALWKWG